MKYLTLTLAIVSTLALAGCLAVSGDLGYTDPKTGATVGFHVGNAPDGKAVKKIKAAPSFRADARRVTLR